MQPRKRRDEDEGEAVRGRGVVRRRRGEEEAPGGRKTEHRSELGGRGAVRREEDERVEAMAW
jgi:hypothetical protein